jgi:hypothetical protein
MISVIHIAIAPAGEGGTVWLPISGRISVHDKSTCQAEHSRRRCVWTKPIRWSTVRR